MKKSPEIKIVWSAQMSSRQLEYECRVGTGRDVEKTAGKTAGPRTQREAVNTIFSGLDLENV